MSVKTTIKRGLVARSAYLEDFNCVFGSIGFLLNMVFVVEFVLRGTNMDTSLIGTNTECINMKRSSHNAIPSLNVPNG